MSILRAREREREREKRGPREERERERAKEKKRLNGHFLRKLGKISLGQVIRKIAETGEGAQKDEEP